MPCLIRLFEVMGEATKRISLEIKTANPQIRWSEMAGMRDVLIHQYQNASNRIIYKTAVEDVPKLIIELRKIIENFKD